MIENVLLRRIETIGQWLHKVAFGELSVMRNSSRRLGPGYIYLNGQLAHDFCDIRLARGVYGIIRTCA